MIVQPSVRALSGRIYIRHPSRQGTIMVFNDRGNMRKVLILDAKYRKNDCLFAQQEIHAEDLGLYYNCGSRISTGYMIHRYYRGDDSCRENFLLNSDDYVSCQFPYSEQTATHTCQKIIEYRDRVKQHFKDRGKEAYLRGYPAIEYVQSLQFENKKCVIPDIQTLIRMWIDYNEIDRMDESLYNDPAMQTENSLKSIWFGSGRVYSSTILSYSAVRRISSTLARDIFGSSSLRVDPLSGKNVRSAHYTWGVWSSRSYSYPIFPLRIYDPVSWVFPVIEL